MEKKQNLSETYFKNKSQPDENDFLDYACEAMFIAYLSKSLIETKRKYVIQLSARSEREYPDELTGESERLGRCDTYDCYFDDLIAPLTDKQQLYLRLSFQLGYTDTMIASYMNIRPQSVHDLRKAAFRKLRKGGTP